MLLLLFFTTVFSLNFSIGLYAYSPNQFRCINGDGCANFNIHLSCVGDFNINCTYYLPGLRMENLEIQCVNINKPNTKSCISTYDLWKTKEYSSLNTKLQSLLLNNNKVEQTIKGTIRSIDDGYFNITTWMEMSKRMNSN